MTLKLELRPLNDGGEVPSPAQGGAVLERRCKLPGLARRQHGDAAAGYFHRRHQRNFQLLEQQLVRRVDVLYVGDPAQGGRYNKLGVASGFRPCLLLVARPSNVNTFPDKLRKLIPYIVR